MWQPHEQHVADRDRQGSETVKDDFLCKNRLHNFTLPVSIYLSAPCPPQNVITSVGCDTGTVSVLWDESVGALSYTATLERTDGETTCCTASSTSCDVTSLPCGQMYVLTVTAEGRTCNSSQSLEVIVRSGNTHRSFNPVTCAAFIYLLILFIVTGIHHNFGNRVAKP